MDFFDKVEDITMMSLLILYNTNPMPLAIYALLPPREPEQQRLDVEELQEKDTFVLTKKKKKGKKVVRRVVNRDVSTTMSSGNLSIARSSQFHAVGKKRMVDEEQLSNDVSTCLDICYAEPLQTPIVEKEVMSTMSMMTILVRR
jgi:hypothetical protein